MNDELAKSSSVTHLLHAASEGDSQAAAALLPMIYDQLRALAAKTMRSERPDLTLQPTALVHEAFLRLIGPENSRMQNQWDGCGHFFSAAALMIRRILVESARRRKRLKRGGGKVRVDFDDVTLAFAEPSDDLIELEEALTQFAIEYPDHARLVDLRYFAGMTIDEVARALNISVRTATRNWAFARAWLYTRLKSDL